jgi:prepilin-type N-terminal cleavage/methylation domain-containing protein
MSKNKIKSFTLPELLVVMIITAIIVGLAFSVLRLVQKQIYTIQTNFEKTNNLILFEQRLWQDFNELNTIQCNSEERSLLMESEIDTVRYAFKENYILRNKDTIKLKIILNKFLFEGKEVQKGNIDALMISGKLELPNYQIFISKKNDITLFMNKEDGF